MFYRYDAVAKTMKVRAFGDYQGERVCEENQYRVTRGTERQQRERERFRCQFLKVAGSHHAYRKLETFHLCEPVHCTAFVFPQSELGYGQSEAKSVSREGKEKGAWIQRNRGEQSHVALDTQGNNTNSQVFSFQFQFS